MTTVIHSFESDESDAESVLEAMGLNGNLLRNVCQNGLAAFLTATPYHPPNAPGSFLYHELVQSLRQALVPLGWEIDQSGLALTFNESLRIAIAVRSGNLYTGNPARTPWFRYPESTTMQEAIGVNARQLGLFDELSGFASLVTPSRSMRLDFSKVRTWWLLHFVDTARSVMRAELSLPTYINASGGTDPWEKRIILEPIPFDDEAKVELFGSDLGGSDFDVPVRKKA